MAIPLRLIGTVARCSALVLMLMLVLMLGARLADARCEKLTDTTLLHVDGYRTRAIITNTCKETTSAVIMPNLMTGRSGTKPFLKRFQDSCCCVVTSSTLDQELLEPDVSNVGRSPALVQYRRIESCGCVRCSLVNSLIDALEVEYSDNMLRR